VTSSPLDLDQLAASTVRQAPAGVLPEPTPLRRREPLPTFPTDALPEPFAAMVTHLAEFTQTDPGMVGTSALSMLAAAAGGRCELEVRPGWREPLNLFTCTVAEPGERKSAVQAEMAAPLLAAERDLVDQAGPVIAEAETLRAIALKASDQAKAKAGNAEGKDRDAKTADAVSAAMMAEAIVVPTLPRLVADDVTPEAAGSLLAEQAGRLAIVSAEGGIFDVIAGRYSGNVPNLDVFLKGHAGDALKVDRKGRPPEYVPNPALTLGLMVQPAVLTAIGEQRSFRGRGLLARFLYTVPPSKVGRRRIDPPAVPGEVRDAYTETVRSLALTLSAWTDPATLTLASDAVSVLFDLARRTEPRLGPEGDLAHLRDWGSKLVGATARLAGLLHLAEHPSDGWRRSVERASVAAAVQLADYYTAHALAAFDEMRADPTIADAEYLLGVIRRHGFAEVSRRDLFTAASRSRFPKAEDLTPAVALLAEHGWLIPREVPAPTGPGRPPSPRWTVHPAAQTAQTAQKGAA
jgi:replicative DNA helicase